MPKDKKDPEYKVINYENLLFDPCNPRLPKSKHNLNEKEIIDFMLLEAATLELMQAIGENDFFRGEQLLVVPVSDLKGKYKVLEGNRRLTSIKLLNNPKLASVKTASVHQVYTESKYRPTEIPCLIFKTEDEIRKYLGFRHITGIKPWGLTEKARYLFQLYNDLYKTLDINAATNELAKKIGSRKDYVKRVLIAYKLYKIIEDEGFYKIKDLDDTTFYVGYLVDSLSKHHIATFLNIDISSKEPLEKLNNENLKELTHWFFQKNEQNKTRLKGKSLDLQMLNAILGNEAACTAFKEGKDLERSFELTEDTGTIFYQSIQNALISLEQADGVVHKLDDFYSDLKEDLVQIRKLTSKIKQAEEDLSRKGPFGDKDEF